RRGRARPPRCRRRARPPPAGGAARQHPRRHPRALPRPPPRLPRRRRPAPAHLAGPRRPPAARGVHGGRGRGLRAALAAIHIELLDFPARSLTVLVIYFA